MGLMKLDRQAAEDLFFFNELEKAWLQPGLFLHGSLLTQRPERVRKMVMMNNSVSINPCGREPLGKRSSLDYLICSVRWCSFTHIYSNTRSLEERNV